MKLVGLMCVKNESWILGASARIALEWCDELVMVDHSSTDDTMQVIHDLQGKYPWRINYSRWDDKGEWDEMEMRDHSLKLGRKFGGTHFAVIDADEILTANLQPFIRDWIQALKPADLLDLPMIPAWRSLTQYRDDGSVWSRGIVSLAFADTPEITWKPQADGYEHHNRPPYGIQNRIRRLQDKRHGGVIHAQWADWSRVTQKHVHYRMMEHLRWPNRMSPAELNVKYSQALDENGIQLKPMPSEWIAPYADLVGEHYKPKSNSWYRWEIQRMLDTHGREKFAGLDLLGF